MHEQVVLALNKVMGDTFVMYYKTHSYHWNIEGPDFYEYHTFLQEIYSEIYPAIDTIAEHIRALDAYAPTSLKYIKDYSTIQEDDIVVGAMQMIKNLLDANNVVLLTLMMAYKIAEEAGEIGVSNFLQDRVIQHQKHGWMLKSTLK
jgi:starvation-inducible DNA-binding protein